MTPDKNIPIEIPRPPSFKQGSIFIINGVYYTVSQNIGLSIHTTTADDRQFKFRKSDIFLGMCLGKVRALRKQVGPHA